MKKIILILVVALLALNSNAQSTPKVSKKAAKKAANAVAATPAAVKAPAVVAPISTDPSIFIASDVVEYGVVNKGGDGVRTFSVVNKGAQPLLLTNCSGSCGCTVPTCPREPILPGKSADISVKYDTNRVGPISKTVTIMSNDPKNPTKTVSIRGEVKDVAAPAPAN